MMERPTCTAHGDLARRLALGRLDDDAAAAAETAVAECPVCQAWWETTFAPAAVIDAAVAEGLTSVTLPARRQHRSSHRLALAATVVMSLGAGALWLAGDRQGPVETAAVPATVLQQETPRVALRTVVDSVVAATVPPPSSAQASSTPASTAASAVARPAAGDERPAAAISRLDFEGAETRIASVAEENDDSAGRDDAISVMSFESGGLRIVVDSTT